MGFESWTFENARVDLHAGAYVNCSFLRCELVFDGRPIHLEGNRFSGCTWDFTGPAGATLKLLEVLCREDPDFARDVGLRFGLLSEHAH